MRCAQQPEIWTPIGNRQLDHHIATATGFRTLGDLIVSDEVIGSTGRAVRVTAIYDRGILPVYTVHTNDSATVTCDGEHLWLVYDNAQDDWLTMTTVEIAAACHAGEQPVIPTLGGAARFVEREFAVPPVVAGLDSAGRHGFANNTPAYGDLRSYDCRDYQCGSVAQRTAFLTAIVAHARPRPQRRHPRRHHSAALQRRAGRYHHRDHALAWRLGVQTG